MTEPEAEAQEHTAEEAADQVRRWIAERRSVLVLVRREGRMASLSNLTPLAQLALVLLWLEEAAPEDLAVAVRLVGAAAAPAVRN